MFPPLVCVKVKMVQTVSAPPKERFGSSATLSAAVGRRSRSGGDVGIILHLSAIVKHYFAVLENFFEKVQRFDRGLCFFGFFYRKRIKMTGTRRSALRKITQSEKCGFEFSFAKAPPPRGCQGRTPDLPPASRLCRETDAFQRPVPQRGKSVPCGIRRPSRKGQPDSEKNRGNPDFRETSPSPGSRGRSPLHIPA